MAFDVSFHPVDRDLIVGRLLPYITGFGSIRDLVDETVRIDTVRGVAKSWGLGLRNLAGLGEDEAQELLVGPTVAALRQRLLPDLHVWGRPFLITDESPVDVAHSYDRWLTCDAGAAEDLACEMVDRLVPGCSPHIQPESIVEPVPEERAVWEARWRLDLLRDAFAALRVQSLVKISPDVEVHPLDLITSELGRVLLMFCAGLRPAWIAQGYCWPTHLFERAGMGRPAFFETAHPLFQPLFDQLPDIDGFLGETLGRGQQIGAYVRPENVPAFTEALDDSESAILRWADQDGWLESCRRDLRKLRECVAYADARGLGVLEASHQYNTAFGVWN